jgi:hypothetical protein
MKKLSTLAAAAVFSSFVAQGQTCDLVFFSDDGQKFTLIVDGDQKNAAPATRVVATGIRNETPMCMIRFEDKSIGEIKKGGYFPLGKEYTVMITTNKKGERVLRPSGEAALGTAAAGGPANARPANFQDDEAAQPAGETMSATQQTSVGGVQSTTSTTVTQTTTEGGDGENVNMAMGVNGVGITMNVNVDDDMDMGGATQTTTTTTTTTSNTSSSTLGTVESAHPAEPTAYSMPGYSGEIGCPWPMNPNEFSDAKSSIESKSFEDTKMTMAKQIAGDRCMTVEQVKGVMGLFSFEDSKLDFAKFAYDHTYDISNYYKVNDAFTFETSVDELNQYIHSR